MRQHLRPSLSLVRQLRWREEPQVLLLVPLFTGAPSSHDNDAYPLVGRCFRMDLIRNRYPILVVCCLPNRIPHLPRHDQSNNLGMSQLGQDKLFEIMAPQFRLSLQHRTKEESDLLLLHRFEW